jgi:hypothetical protein
MPISKGYTKQNQNQNNYFALLVFAYWFFPEIQNLIIYLMDSVYLISGNSDDSTKVLYEPDLYDQDRYVDTKR